jgi:predicted O-methyltransferase YrrM
MSALSVSREAFKPAYMPSVDESPLAPVLAELHAGSELSWVADSRSERAMLSPAQGRFLYLLARATGATTVVEIGSGAGVATLYLAAAVRDNWGGRVLAVEPDANQRRLAAANTREAGVGPFVDWYGEDARAAITGLAGPVDMVRLAAWQDDYQALFDALLPRLRPGAILVANRAPVSQLPGPWLARLSTSAGSLGSVTVPLGAGLEFAVLS